MADPNRVIAIATVFMAVCSFLTWWVYRKLAGITTARLTEMRESSKTLREQADLLAKQVSIFDEYITLLFVVEREKGSGNIHRQNQYAQVLDRVFSKRLAKIDDIERRRKEQDELAKVLTEITQREKVDEGGV